MATEELPPAPGGDEADRELKARHRRMWALGDYPTVSRELVAPFGPRLVEACDISPGQRVLDVGAGAGNVAIPAAERGASVVASDLTPELFDAGRREAAARGVELEWVEADAESLPFPDDEFDVVVSSIGAMFAPHHQAVADELVRVTRPGSVIGMINWTPEGWTGHMFKMMAPYAPPPPPGAQSPLLWGNEEHVRELFGERVSSLELTRESLAVTHSGKPLDVREYFKAKFGPTIATYAHIAHDPEQVTALDRDFAEFVTSWNRGEPGGPACYELEYLLVVARKPW
ncbi:MAG: class I SAM-dependent methyltransferase [Actinomycetota bacterium]|nr:class I SAM-dependent methyltransferase [Actinomycetota bacterium]